MKLGVTAFKAIHIGKTILTTYIHVTGLSITSIDMIKVW